MALKPFWFTQVLLQNKTKQNTSSKKPWLRIKFSIPDPHSKKLVGPESVYRVGFATDILGFPHTWKLTSRWKKKKKKKFFFTLMLINILTPSSNTANSFECLIILFNECGIFQSFTTLTKIWVYAVSFRKMLFRGGKKSLDVFIVISLQISVR